MQTAKLIGGAGTGKTTALLDIMAKLIDAGTHPLDIGFASFTRVAAREAATRAAEQFHVDPTDLQREGHFNTLHATCKRLLGVGRELITDNKEGRQWVAESLDEKVDGGDADNETTEDGFAHEKSDADRALELWHVARNRLESLNAVHAAAVLCDDHTPGLGEVTRIVERYEQAKRLDGRCDFTDLLSRFAGWECSVDGHERASRHEGDPPEIPAWIFDEAQDTSALSHAVQERLTSADACKWVYAAGDPFQSIFGWNGADPQHFMNLKADKTRVMPKSYRCPADILRTGEDILRNCSDYWDRKIQPADHEGSVESAWWTGDVFDQIDPAESWLLLARTNMLADRMVRELNKRLVPWIPTKKNAGCRWRAPVRNEAIKALDGLQRGAPIDGLQWCHILDQLKVTMSGERMFVQGTKKRFDDLADPQGEYPWVQLLDIDKLGGTMAFAEAVHTGKWREWLKGVDDYMSAVGVWGQEAVDKPRCKVGTIHSVKGAEAENVLLLTTVTRQCQRAAETVAGSDEESRVFYVGATRARRRLIVLKDQRCTVRKKIEV